MYPYTIAKQCPTIINDIYSIFNYYYNIPSALEPNAELCPTVDLMVTKIIKHPEFCELILNLQFADGIVFLSSDIDVTLLMNSPKYADISFILQYDIYNVLNKIKCDIDKDILSYLKNYIQIYNVSFQQQCQSVSLNINHNKLICTIFGIIKIFVKKIFDCRKKCLQSARSSINRSSSVECNAKYQGPQPLARSQTM